MAAATILRKRMYSPVVLFSAYVHPVSHNAKLRRKRNEMLNRLVEFGGSGYKNGMVMDVQDHADKSQDALTSVFDVTL